MEKRTVGLISNYKLKKKKGGITNPNQSSIKCLTTPCRGESFILLTFTFNLPEKYFPSYGKKIGLLVLDSMGKSGFDNIIF